MSNSPIPADSKRPVRLALEDGSIFQGVGFGRCCSDAESTGEVVFNTAMCGYQEAITDPSYTGQILVMTAPMIGNYGVCTDDIESSSPQIAGLIVRELSRCHSNYRSVNDLSSWLEDAGVIGLEGIDTRALVRKLRTTGAMRGVLCCDPANPDAELIERANAIPPMSGQNLAAKVSVREESRFDEDRGEWGSNGLISGANQPRQEAHPAAEAQSATLRVLALDCGGKRNIYRHLVERGCAVHIAPHDLSAEQIRAWRPDGLFVSNGPGDPYAVAETVAVLREVAGEFPTFGICLGHQLLALALGARTYKLKFGHRGTNQPVRNLVSQEIEITSQNHGFCVEGDSLPPELEATHIHLNDNTLSGFRHRKKPIFAVQYHPEASPGPHDSSYLFDCFIAMMLSGEPVVLSGAQRNVYPGG